MSSLVSLSELAARIPDGARLAIAQDSVGVAMAATRELVRRGARGLRLVCVPLSGMQADILIGAGCVAAIETSAVTLGEYGGAPRFAAALRGKRIELRDATCPAIHAALQAGEKNIPFMPLRGLVGSDLLAHRADWKVVDNPFAGNTGDGPREPIVLLPAIRPDVALIHAPLADRDGNVWIGRRRDALTMAHASFATLATVEAVRDTSLFDDPALAAGTVPAIYIDAIALAPNGAWPIGMPDTTAPDPAALQAYASAAKDEAGFSAWLAGWLQRDWPVAGAPAPIGKAAGQR
jgi:glutaconate CoA-transferase subunit A